MYCTKCELLDGKLFCTADFVVNGESVCQKHADLPATRDAVSPLHDVQQRLISAATTLETDAMQRECAVRRSSEAARLKAKAEGVRLALSYIYDALYTQR